MLCQVCNDPAAGVNVSSCQSCMRARLAASKGLGRESAAMGVAACSACVGLDVPTMRQTCWEIVQNWPRAVDMWDTSRLVNCWRPPNNVTRCLECAVRTAPGVGCVIQDFEAIWELEGPMREAVLDAWYACEVHTPGLQSMEDNVKWSEFTCRHCSAPSAAQTLACLKALAQEPDRRQLVAYCYTTFTGQAVQQCLACARDMQARFGGTSPLVCRPWRTADAPVLWKCLAGASTQQAVRACAF